MDLRAGITNIGVAGGAHMILAPDLYINFAKAKMLSPNGRCATFDEAADGFCRAEGHAVVVLKRLSDAQRDGDPIQALLLGSATNQDGRSNGLTAPNGLAQQGVIRQALAEAQLTPDAISYVECHGTGTSLGDPIEPRDFADPDDLLRHLVAAQEESVLAWPEGYHQPTLRWGDESATSTD